MIKFRYVYSNRKEIKSFIYTIEEIERGKTTSEFWRDLMCDDFKLISRDRFTGLKDKNDIEMFENDNIDILGTIGEVIYNKHLSGFMYCTDESEELLSNFSYVPFEIISNTHQKT